MLVFVNDLIDAINCKRYTLVFIGAAGRDQNFLLRRNIKFTANIDNWNFNRFGQAIGCKIGPAWRNAGDIDRALPDISGHAYDRIAVDERDSWENHLDQSLEPGRCRAESRRVIVNDNQFYAAQPEKQITPVPEGLIGKIDYAYLVLQYKPALFYDIRK